MTHSSPHNELDGCIALVTGAESGIGYAIAERLLNEGASLALHYCFSEESVNRLVHQFGEDRCLAIQENFQLPDAAKRLFDTVWNWRNRFDILVNNAAVIEPVESIDAIGESELARTLQINTVAPFILSTLALKAMRQAKFGRIVHISSIGVQFGGSPATAHYMISKAALEASVKALAKAGAADNVLVNAIRAGVTNTDVHQRLGRDLSKREALIPMGRAAEPDEIAEAVYFLVSPRNTYITGTILPVAGGE